MEKEYKEYRYRGLVFIVWPIQVLLFFVLAFIFYFLEGDIVVFRVVGIFSFLLGLVWIAAAIHAVKNPVLKTTEEEIVFSEIPYVKTRHIPVKDIVEIEIQMDKMIWPGVFIWYHHKNKIRKVRIITKSLRKEDQKEFRTYLEDLTVSRAESTKGLSTH